jgi:hypothetical protein
MNNAASQDVRGGLFYFKTTTPANNRAINNKPAMNGPFVMYAGREGIQL